MACGRLVVAMLVAATMGLASCASGGNASNQTAPLAQGANTNPAKTGYSTMDAPGLQSEIDAGQQLVIVDLREPELYRAGHIPGAQNIPFEQFKDRMNELSPESNIVVVCHTGPMGEVSGTLLAERGYASVRNLRGGMAAWSGQLVR